jgi:hypothetical protein
MTDYDSSEDQDTKIIVISPAELSELRGDAQGAADLTQAGVVILPDGTKPIKMGSGYVTGILGEGGMAIVYEIWNEQLGVKRAVKLLRPNSSRENIERFEREIKITAQLDHPNIIDIHAMGEWNGLPYIEMEMIDGISLSELIQRQGTLPLEVCSAIAIIVCRALLYTHNHEYTVGNQSYKGLLHRDLKPGNILFSRAGVVRLTDFGVATPTNVAPSTSSGKVVGSMQYLAPEQLEEDEVDIRADIFSLGCILYEMLTGEKTFPDQNITHLIRKRLKNEFKPLSSYKQVSVPLRLNTLIGDCLQLNPAKRPSDIRAVIQELEKIHSGITLKNPEDIIIAYARGENFEEDLFLKRKTFPTWAIAGVAVTALCIVATGVYFLLSTVSGEKKQGASPVSTAKGAKTPIQPTTRKSTQVQPVKTSGTNASPRQAGKKPLFEKSQVPVPVQSARPKVSAQPSAAGPGKNTRQFPVARGRSLPTEDKKSLVNDNNLFGDVSGPETILTKMEKKYKTRDVIAILKKEDAAGNYSNVLDICNHLQPQQAAMIEARLLRHRALVGTKQVTKSYFDNNNINDGEFYLSKAKFLCDTRQYQRAIWILGSIKKSQTLLLNQETVNRDMLYYMAKSNTGLFDAKRTLERQRVALQSWSEVKNQYRNNQSSPRFVEADSEISRIGKIHIDAEP